GVQGRSAHQYGDDVALAAVVDGGSCHELELRHRGGPVDVDDVDEVVPDPLPFRPGRFGRTDVHPPVDQHRVEIDQLTTNASCAQAFGNHDRHRRLADRCRTDHHRNHHAGHCACPD